MLVVLGRSLSAAEIEATSRILSELTRAALGLNVLVKDTLPPRGWLESRIAVTLVILKPGSSNQARSKRGSAPIRWIGE
jgi:hypothetical protein